MLIRQSFEIHSARSAHFFALARHLLAMRSRFKSGNRFIQRSQTGTELLLLNSALLDKCGPEGVHFVAVDPSRRTFPDRTGAALRKILLDTRGNEPDRLVKDVLQLPVAGQRESIPE